MSSSRSRPGCSGNRRGLGHHVTQVPGSGQPRGNQVAPRKLQFSSSSIFRIRSEPRTPKFRHSPAPPPAPPTQRFLALGSPPSQGPAPCDDTLLPKASATSPAANTISLDPEFEEYIKFTAKPTSPPTHSSISAKSYYKQKQYVERRRATTSTHQLIQELQAGPARLRQGMPHRNRPETAPGIMPNSDEVVQEPSRQRTKIACARRQLKERGAPSPHLAFFLKSSPGVGPRFIATSSPRSRTPPLCTRPSADHPGRHSASALGIVKFKDTVTATRGEPALSAYSNA